MGYRQQPIVTDGYRIATGDLAQEMRNMKVGDVIRFPFEKYKYSSVRATPSSTLANERAKGQRWKTCVSYEEAFTQVTRIS